MSDEQKTQWRDEEFMDKLLVVVDGSETSELAVEFALRFAHKTGCRLEAVYPIDTAQMDYLLKLHYFVSDERTSLEADLEAKARSYLLRVEAVAVACQLELQTTILRGCFHTTLLKYARENAVKGIVLGGCRFNSEEKNFSTNERRLLLELAECPVFFIPMLRKAPCLR